MTKRRPENSKKPSGAQQPDDLELWAKVTASVTPLKRRTPVRETSKPKSAQVKETKTATADQHPAATKSHSKTVSPAARTRRTPVVRDVPQLTGLDRRTSQKMTRGKTDIDGRLDLHGMTQHNARSRLRSFLADSRSAGRRTVLVITGKGYSPYSSHTLHGYQQVDTPEREGVLRRALPQWLDETEFRVHVAGYQPAHPRHGGGGAFYIRLRKP